MRRRTFLQALAAAPLAGAAPLRVVDSRTGKPLPARILIRAGEGGDAERDYVPPGAVETPIWRDHWFVAESPIMLPPGDGYTFRLEHGTEYRPLKTSATSIALERWIDMRRLGYKSGDNHLHVPAGPLVRMMEAEGLDFGASLDMVERPEARNSARCGYIARFRS